MKGRQLDTERMCRVSVNVDKDFGWDVTAMSAFAVIQLLPDRHYCCYYWSNWKIVRVRRK